MGRPKKPAGERAKRVNVSLPPNMLRVFDWLAAECQSTRSGLLEDLLTRAADKRGVSVYDKRFDPPRIADEALAIAEGRRFPKTALDKLLEAANAIDSVAVWKVQGGESGRWMSEAFGEMLNKALAALKETP